MFAWFESRKKISRAKFLGKKLLDAEGAADVSDGGALSLGMRTMILSEMGKWHPTCLIEVCHPVSPTENGRL